MVRFMFTKCGASFDLNLSSCHVRNLAYNVNVAILNTRSVVFNTEFGVLIC